jgi:hypothetical protein
VATGKLIGVPFASEAIVASKAPVGWEVFLVRDRRNILLAFAGSEAQAKRYAKQAEAQYGLKKKKKKNDRATDPLPILK